MIFYRKFPRIARLLVLLMIGTILFGGMLYFVKNGQQPVLLYLYQPGTDYETIMRSSLNSSPEVFLAEFGSLQDMQPSPDGKWLGVIITDADGAMQVEVYNTRSAKLESSYDCSDMQCSALEWKTDASALYFHQFSNGSKSSILSLNITTDQIEEVPIDARYAPLYFSPSPDGRYQVIYDENAKGFFVLDNWKLELILVKSEGASPVLWLNDPLRVLLVATEHEDKIPVTHITEITPGTLQIRYLKDSDITNMDFNNLAIHPNGEDLVFGCRPVLHSSSRQLCVSNMTEFIGEQLTNKQSRNHAGAVFDSSGTWLAYQTYNLESSASKPTIWVMGWSTGSTIQVADNAAMPRWIP